jgi:hypothetical protein
MYVLVCCMSSALQRLPESDRSSMISAKQHLAAAIAFGEAYHKTWNSIHWNNSRAAVKRRTCEKLHNLAFEAYTELLTARTYIYQYLDEVGSDALPSNWWRDFGVSIYLAVTGMEKNNGTQIWQRQLSLF